MSNSTLIDTSDNSVLMQALHDPENQPSQFGTVPVEYLERAENMMNSLAWQFDTIGCTCCFDSDDCCAYARWTNYKRGIPK